MQPVKQIIERLYPYTNKMELFSRNQRPGWDVWGNEVESDESITKALTGQAG